MKQLKQQIKDLLSDGNEMALNMKQLNDAYNDQLALNQDLHHQINSSLLNN